MAGRICSSKALAFWFEPSWARMYSAMPKSLRSSRPGVCPADKRGPTKRKNPQRRHNCTIIDQVKDRSTRERYIKKTIENGPHGLTRIDVKSIAKY